MGDDRGLNGPTLARTPAYEDDAHSKFIISSGRSIRQRTNEEDGEEQEDNDEDDASHLAGSRFFVFKLTASTAQIE